MVLSQNREPFDIRNYYDRLTPTKRKHRYECPVCGGHSLTINQKSGAYKCWSNECDSKDIREAIAPELFNSSNYSSHSRLLYKRKPKPLPPTPAPIPSGDIELATLPYSPTPSQPINRGRYTEIKYPYSPTQWVLRKQNPDGKKITLPYHTSSNGEVVCGKGDKQWHPYCWDEVLKYGIGKWVLGAEGEKDTDNSRSDLKLVTFTFQGASWGEDSLSTAANRFKNAGIAGIIYFPDNDDAGRKKAEKLAYACAKAKLPFIAINPVRMWSECPDKGDISDWIDSGLASITALNQEIATSISIEYKPKDRLITRKEWESAKSFKELLELVPKLKARFTSKKQSWGFSKDEPKVTQKEPCKVSTYTYTYEKCDSEALLQADRVSTWINSPHKYIFDSSGTGSGKSYDAGNLQPSDFDCEKIFYISNDSRNPTTPTLQQGWAHLEGRHNGLIRDDKGKLRRKKDGDKYVVSPNCARTDTINALKNANIRSAYSANVACQNCAYLEACRGGHLFGYLNDRAKTFSNSRIISHPQSLPSPGEDFDYSDSVLVWEEWSQIFKNFESVQVTARDVDMLITALATDNLELLQQLHPLLNKIKSILTSREKAPTRYGWSYEHLKELFYFPENIDLVALEEATAPDLLPLNPTLDSGVDIADLPASVRKRFQQRDNVTAQEVKQSVLKQWILPLLEILKGDCTGYISCDFNHLTITTPNTRLAEIAASAKKNIFLDATGRVIDLAQLLVIPYTQIFSCKQKAETPSNLEVIQVAGLGRMGISRGDDQQRRGKAVCEEITKQSSEKGESCELITFKKFDGKYQWFVDSRGSNDLEGIQNIILDGIPTPNLEALKAEFTCIYGRTPLQGTKTVKQSIKLNNPMPDGVQPDFDYEVSIDNDFADFIRHRILETIDQAIGRNRADRYPDREFKVYILGDFPLDLPVTLTQASEITPEAATKLERLQLAIKKAVELLLSEGKKVTQKAIAKLANVSQQRISQLREFLLVLLKGTIYTKTSKNNSPPNTPPDGEWVAKTYLPLIASEPRDTMLESISVLFDGYSLPDLIKIWEMTDGKTQIDLLSALLGAFPISLAVMEPGY
ncbi:hypothetical protein IQ247_13975 [Plectonema cf. radiosum LEGE 06105]|uniref:Uncharacterized protein n=1 Tax=Plectonema cf. radiosum LEGE 06105 TaxID=945769 RepID=A0A8J7F804_9CYAN|nr:hypothetical protein [Plectonema radiosum]MBE9213759.1 hypothetical protein [Plectonema cf. radiosum LEGE 06105]